ncbi:MAG TPA: hypothetical protein VNZ22_20480, partial [Bacillota bacterium]|nr:hypothetical protein [Bacillota bacterium]
MLACLLAGNYVIRVLEWPLSRAPMKDAGKVQTVRVLFGTNQVGMFRVSTNEPFSAVVGTNRFVRLELTPITIG